MTINCCLFLKSKLLEIWIHFFSFITVVTLFKMFFRRWPSLEHGRSFQIPPLKISMQSFVSASLLDKRLGSWWCQFEKINGAFEWSHTYEPSMSMSFKPVQAVQSSQIIERQFTEIKRVYKNKVILLFYHV